MKKTVFILLMILGVFTSYGQIADTFREDYGYIRVFNPEDNEWTEWVESDNTVVFNLNDNGDIKLYMADGSVHLYRCVSGFSEMQMDDGTIGQYASFLDEKGFEITVLYHEKGNFILTDQSEIIIVLAH